MNLKYISYILLVTFLSCNEEPYGSIADEDNDSNQIEGNFFPAQGYWIYDVNSYSADAPEMNFTALDSVYIDQAYENYFSLAANDGSFANGAMHMILTNVDLYDTPNSLTLNGNLSLPENLSTFGVAEDFLLEDLTIFDLDADDGEMMFTQSGIFSNNFEIQNNEVPIEVNYEIKTTKISFHNNITLNGTDYNNVFQGELAFSISVSGTFSLFGFSQTLDILDTQDIISISYYYAESIGLVRAESLQGFSLSPQLINVLDLLNTTLEIPFSLSIENTENLSLYFTD